MTNLEVRRSLTSRTNQTQIKTEFLSSDDPYKFSRTEVEFPLLTDLQRSSLIDIDSKLEEFENIIKKSASNYKECFCNGIIVNGQPGTGKTYNIMRWLEDLQEAGKIYGYETYSGKISPVTLYKVLKETTEKKIF
jgi:Cdc6-like AAA superfamily ATPase